MHDIDANKLGGSIKISVKTYVHSLKLQKKKRLEDVAAKDAELSRRLDEKRLELLRMKQEQLAARSARDGMLEEQINALASKVAAYQSPAAAPEPSEFADPRNSFHEKSFLCRAAANNCVFAAVNCASPGSPTTSAVIAPGHAPLLPTVRSRRSARLRDRSR